MGERAQQRDVALLQPLPERKLERHYRDRRKEEREEIFKFAKGSTDIPLMAGIGSSSTLEACELADIALKNNINECLAVTPYYNKPSQKGLSLHYQELCKTGANIMLYNVPGRTGVDL